jgi:hypothetical protein
MFGAELFELCSVSQFPQTALDSGRPAEPVVAVRARPGWQPRVASPSSEIGIAVETAAAAVASRMPEVARCGVIRGFAKEACMPGGTDQGLGTVQTAFDVSQELVWTGSEGGWLTSFHVPSMERHSSVHAHESRVLGLKSLPDIGMLSTSEKHVKLHSAGGFLHWSCSDDVRNSPTIGPLRLGVCSSLLVVARQTLATVCRGSAAGATIDG